jgi:hypothetical protein
MKNNKPLHDTEVIGRATEELLVTITTHEVLGYAEELARCETQLQELATHAEAMKKDLKAKESAILARRSELAAIVREKRASRPVEVQLLANFTAGTLSKVRVDTGETVAQRKLSDEERQSRLPLEATGGHEARSDGP